MTDNIQIWITASPDAAVRKEGYWSLHGDEWMRQILPSDVINFLPGGFDGAVERMAEIEYAMDRIAYLWHESWEEVDESVRKFRCKSEAPKLRAALCMPELVKLSEESMRQIADLIENPPEPSEALRKLFEDKKEE